MRECIELGSTPIEEDCAQIGSNDYSLRARKECKAYINQLKRMFPEYADIEYRIKSNPHDFGTYYEVVVCYDTNDKVSIEQAFDIEDKLPEYWDSLAKEELK